MSVPFLRIFPPTSYPPAAVSFHPRTFTVLRLFYCGGCCTGNRSCDSPSKCVDMSSQQQWGTQDKPSVLSKNLRFQIFKILAIALNWINFPQEAQLITSMNTSKKTSPLRIQIIKGKETAKRRSIKTTLRLNAVPKLLLNQSKSLWSCLSFHFRIYKKGENVPIRNNLWKRQKQVLTHRKLKISGKTELSQKTCTDID